MSKVTLINGTKGVLLTSFSGPELYDYWDQLFKADSSGKTSGVLPATMTSGALYYSNSYPANLRNHVTKHVRRLLNLPSSFDALPIGLVAKQWPNAWFLWKPDINWQDIYPRIAKPFYSNVYFVGSAIAPGSLQLYAEGALKTVDDLITTYFSN